MSKTASIQFAPTNGFFGRLLASIDRFLLDSARIAICNGDLPYFRAVSAAKHRKTAILSGLSGQINTFGGWPNLRVTLASRRRQP